jgi:hypothetical protein
MTAVRMPEHISSCSYRKIECENEGCGVSYCFIDLYEHKSTCQYEKLTCCMSFGDLVCEEVVIRKDFAAHQHECPLRPVTCPNGCGCIMSVKDEKSHSCIIYLSQGMQAMTREVTSLTEENIALRRELDDVRLQLRRREEEEEKSSCLSALLIPTECYTISSQRVGPLPIRTLTQKDMLLRIGVPILLALPRTSWAEKRNVLTWEM